MAAVGGACAVAGPIIAALVISLVSIGAVAFQALKADIRAVETRLIAVEARLREEIRASEARQREDVTALSDNLGRVLESLLATR